MGQCDSFHFTEREELSDSPEATVTGRARSTTPIFFSTFTTVKIAVWPYVVNLPNWEQQGAIMVQLCASVHRQRNHVQGTFVILTYTNG